MIDPEGPSRRSVLGVGAGAGFAALSGFPAVPAAAQANPAGALTNLDPIQTELVMNLVVTCASPEKMGPSEQSKDGRRGSVWPIIGGRFWGPRISGSVVPGGADYPVVRPDGVVVIDALYRLRTSDGTNIIIHNVGLAYPGQGGRRYRYRLAPTFTTAEGPHDWLNKSLFLSTLIAGNDFPKQFAMAKGPNENDRLIQVHRII